MRALARKLFLALSLAATAAALAGGWSTASADEQLQEFDNFVCPADCPPGAEVCCATLPEICSDGDC